jgi:hypothetical protein
MPSLPVSSPPSIGDKLRSNLKLVIEEFPLPNTRNEVLATIKRALEQGGVQKLQLQIGAPIKIHRYVKADDLGPVKELVDENIFKAAMNALVEESALDQAADGFRVLFEAFQTISQKGVVPKAVIVPNFSILKKWLRLPQTYNLRDLFGVEITTHDEVPDDVGLIACTAPDDGTVITYSLKFFIEEPPAPKKGKK